MNTFVPIDHERSNTIRDGFIIDAIVRVIGVFPFSQQYYVKGFRTSSTIFWIMQCF